MDVRSLQEEMRKLSSIVDGWDSSESVSEIERDLVLEKLRALYEVVRFFDAPSTESTEVEEPVEIDLGIDFSFGALSVDMPSEPEIIQQPEPESESEPEVAHEPEPNVEPELETEPEVESEIELEPESLSVVEPEGDVSEEKLPETENIPVAAPTLFGMDPDEDMLRHRQKQRVIMSLYHDEPARSEIGALAASLTSSDSEKPEDEQSVAEAEPLPEPIAEPEHAATAGYAAEPAEEDPFGEENPFEEISIPKPVGDTAPGAVLGEVINHDVQTLADTIAPHRDVASDLRRNESIGDLRRAIGLNDRFLLVRDLFEGDADACDAALEELNSCESLDDCMIYIAENYVWNPNSDGAKFLMELIERKFA